MKKLDTYLADLLVGNVKLHNLHWNVVGITFKSVHEYFKDLYDSFLEKFDEVAEYQKQVGVYPKSSVKEYMELSQIEELGDVDISTKDALKVGLDLITYMRDSALVIQEEAEDFVLSNMMEDHVTEYNKEIWFMASMLK